MKRYLFLFLILIFSFFTTAILFSEPLYHQVQKGDTLYSLSKRYQISIEEIKSLNHLDDNAIKIGSQLLVSSNEKTTPVTTNQKSDSKTVKPLKQPKKNGWVQYQIEKGDTLYSLARRYEVPVSKLMKENNLGKEAVIKMGEILWVPSPTLSMLDEKVMPQEKLDVSKTPINTKNDKIIWTDPKIEVKGEKVSASKVLWPAKGTLHRRKGKVEGVIIEGKLGDPVVSICSGTVVWANSFRGYQKMVVVQAPSGYNYTYCGNNELFVKVGDKVKVGTQIGTVGYTSFDDKVPNVLLITYKGEKWVDPVLAPRN